MGEGQGPARVVLEPGPGSPFALSSQQLVLPMPGTRSPFELLLCVRPGSEHVACISSSNACNRLAKCALLKTSAFKGWGRRNPVCVGPASAVAQISAFLGWGKGIDAGRQGRGVIPEKAGMLSLSEKCLQGTRN